MGNRTGLLAIAMCALLTGANVVHAEIVFQSHEEVAQWLNSNFEFDTGRARTIRQRLKETGPSGLLIRHPDKLYEDSTGYCADAANFAIHHLNKINPAYKARWVFIDNAMGRPNHWVAAFTHNGKLYIMDYGAGKKWSAMNGMHGPYDSLDDYRDFLATLNLPDFAVGDVYYRNMPGQED